MVRVLGFMAYLICQRKPCNDVAKSGFYYGLSLGWCTKEFLCELEYSSVGLYFMGSGGQGGAFNAVGKACESSLMRWYGHLCDSFGSSYGFL